MFGFAALIHLQAWLGPTSPAGQLNAECEIRTLSRSEDTFFNLQMLTILNEYFGENLSILVPMVEVSESLKTLFVD